MTLMTNVVNILMTVKTNGEDTLTTPMTDGEDTLMTPFMTHDYLVTSQMMSLMTHVMTLATSIIFVVLMIETK
jgi:hypothetical protein